MRSKLTIEQAKRLRNDFESWQQDYDPKDDKEQYDMFGRGMAAMDMLIAGMYQEPVAYIGKQWTLVYYTPPMSMGLKIGDKLYRHAQPAPVVPEEITSASAPEVFEIAAEAERLGLRGTYASYAVGWNACRAAMLQGAENTESRCGNSPVIPDRWIPVSERMPETDGNYWGWWSESKRQGPAWFIKSELQAQFQSSEITHWIPLPSAPQEVKGE